MRSTGLISVKKPYIEFDFDSLNNYDKGNDKNDNQHTKNIVTEPIASGTNINIKMATKSIITLPDNPNYWPYLSATVKDYVLKGIYEPTLGYFSLNLRHSFRKTNQLRDDYNNNKSVFNVKTAIKSIHPRLKDINEKVLFSLRNYIVKNVNYGWQVLNPDLQLNKVRGKPEPIKSDMIVILPNYVDAGKGKYREQYREIIEKNGEYRRVGYDMK